MSFSLLRPIPHHLQWEQNTGRLFSDVLFHSYRVVIAGATISDWAHYITEYLIHSVGQIGLSDWLGHLIRKNLSPIWPIMCLVGRQTLLNQSTKACRTWCIKQKLNSVSDMSLSPGWWCCLARNKDQRSKCCLVFQPWVCTAPPCLCMSYHLSLLVSSCLFPSVMCRYSEGSSFRRFHIPKIRCSKKLHYKHLITATTVGLPETFKKTRNTFCGTCICPMLLHAIHRYRNIWL